MIVCALLGQLVPPHVDVALKQSGDVDMDPFAPHQQEAAQQQAVGAPTTSSWLHLEVQPLLARQKRPRSGCSPRCARLWRGRFR